MGSRRILGLGITFIAFSSLLPSLAPGSDAGHAYSVFFFMLHFPLKLGKQLLSFIFWTFLSQAFSSDLTISRARCTRRLEQRTSATQYQAREEGRERDRQSKILKVGMSREGWGSCKSCEEKE